MNPSLVGHPNKRGSPLTAELLLHICSQWTQFPFPIISYITFPCLCIFAFFQLWIQQIWRKRFHLFFSHKIRSTFLNVMHPHISLFIQTGGEASFLFFIITTGGYRHLNVLVEVQWCTCVWEGFLLMPMGCAVVAECIWNKATSLPFFSSCSSWQLIHTS